jgi:putative endonuclease
LIVLEDKNSNWYVYMVECADKTIYTGITNNIGERINKHNAGKGAKYTRSKGPVVLKAFWSYANKSEAAQSEYAFKKLSRTQKLALIESFTNNKTITK